MTKVEAIAEIMKANGGTASLKKIYDNIEQYYPTAKNSAKWEEGIRGVLYRDLDKRFKRIGLSLYCLIDYKEDVKPKKGDVRMHSYMEGLCVEIGNMQDYDTYTADPSQLYRDNLYLHDVVTVPQFPNFTYEEIINEARRIDVVWFNNDTLKFPQKTFEVVDSIGTLVPALNRNLQLAEFPTKFFIVAPHEYRKKYEQTIKLAPYKLRKERFKFIEYEELEKYYKVQVESKKIEKSLFF